MKIKKKKIRHCKGKKTADEKRFFLFAYKKGEKKGLKNGGKNIKRKYEKKMKRRT